MEERKRGLGRGLSALIGDTAEQPVSAAAAATAAQPAAGQTDGMVWIGIDQLQPGKFQPRKHFDDEELAALAASIGKSGVLQPLLVRPAGDGAYEIIAGERRWRAAQQARLHQVPAIVQPINDVTALEIGIIENVQRADLNPIEEAEGYQRLIDEFAYTQAELAETIGKSRSHIANLLRLTGAPEPVKKALIDGSISMGHARALLTADHAAELVRQIISEGLSVRAVEKLAGAAASATGGASPSPSGAPARPEKSADTRALEKSIADSLGLRVSLDDKGGDKGGSLRIDYKSLDQLDALIAKLTQSAG